MNSNEKLEWEKDFESLDNVYRLKGKRVQKLQDFLRNPKHQKSDSFLNSIGYYLFTGRKGAWVYQGQDSLCIVCWHPNISGKLLAFPEIGEQTGHLHASLLASIPLPPNDITIGRLSSEETNALYTTFSKESCFSAKVIEEKTLDWRFPIRIVSTEDVSHAKGKKYKSIRNRFKKINKDRHQISLQRLSTLGNDSIARLFLEEWALDYMARKKEGNYNDLTSPYETLLNINKQQPKLFDGYILYYNGKPEGLSIWDYTSYSTANAFANVCNTNIKGLSDFQTVTTCRILNDLGIEFLNRGGSETKGLDKFKAKFQPIKSIECKSITLSFAQERAPSKEPSNNNQQIYVALKEATALSL